MATPREPIVVPEVGATPDSLSVSCWLAEFGEEVVVGDAVVEIAMKGVTFDVEAPTSGVLQHIDRFEGSKVSAGDTLGWIQTPDDPAATPQSPDRPQLPQE